MKRLLQRFIVLNSTLPSLRSLSFNAQRQPLPAPPFSWSHLRSAVALLSALLITFAALPLLTNQAHAEGTTTAFPHLNNQIHAGSITLDNYMCGSDAQFRQDAINTWAPVTAGEIVTEPDGTVVHAVGYQGGSGASGSSSNCSGNYNYGLDQYYHLAQWEFQTYIPAHNTAGDALRFSQCTTSVFVPTWYAGAPDAQYTLTITGASRQTVSFDAFNQDQSSSGWYTLTINGQNQFTLNALPSSGTFSYDFLLTLRNGGGQGGQWYLGADAIHFTCNS